MDGKNVADFIDKDIAAKLEALEREEEKLIAEGYYESASDDDMEIEEDNFLSDRREPRKKQVIDKDTMRRISESRGRKRIRSESRGVSIARSQSNGGNATLSKRVKTGSVSQVRDRSLMGVNGEKQRAVIQNIKAKGERVRNLLAKAGEADRTIPTRMPKHLFSGKRGFQASHRQIEFKGISIFKGVNHPTVF